YGVTDWVYVTLHDKARPLDSSTIAKMSLEYLVLSVNAEDVLGVFQSEEMNSRNGQSKLYFLLDGASSPDIMSGGELGEEGERRRWMGETPVGNSTVYLRWEKYAAFLNYRRIYLQPCQSNNQTKECVTEPFHFAFIPGSLLHRGSKVRVTFYLHAGVRYTSTDDVSDSWVEEHIAIIPVSAQISSASRFDRDVYTPRVVPQRHIRHSNKMARTLFLVFALAIVAVLAASFCIETHYRRALHFAKRRLRQQSANTKDNAPRERPLGQVFAPPQEQNGTAHKNDLGAGGGISGGHFENRLAPSGILTRYGVVQLEPTRVEGSEEDSGCAVAPASTPA
ncbi:hypothetical protein TcCL_Unassigned05998, partial [Trypanosoma cruzi]